MRKFFSITSLFIAFGISSVTFAKGAPSAGPKLPLADPGYSSWTNECRKPKEWTLNDDVDVYSNYINGKKIEGLQRGVVVKPLQSLNVVVKPLSIKILKNFGRFRKGDTAYLIAGGPDASYRVWYRGKISMDRHDEDQKKRFEAVDIPVDLYEMWVKIRYASGNGPKSGWVKATENACVFALDRK